MGSAARRSAWRTSGSFQCVNELPFEEVRVVKFIVAFVVAISCFATVKVSAQSTLPSPKTSTAIPEKTALGTVTRTNLDQESGTLSDKLSASKGVIKPMAPVDPAIQKPTPQAGTMPVIKPGDISGGTAK